MFKKYATETNGEDKPQNFLFSLQHEDPHLIHPSLYQLHSLPPKDSSIGSCTSAQLCIKVPTGYSGMPQIHPQNCPFPSTITTYLIHAFLDRPLPPPQMASRSTQPFCHNTFSEQKDRLTDGLGDKHVPRVLTLY